MCTTYQIKRIGLYFEDKNSKIHIYNLQLSKIEKMSAFAQLLPTRFDELIYYYVIRPSCAFLLASTLLFVECDSGSFIVKKGKIQQK